MSRFIGIWRLSLGKLCRSKSWCPFSEIFASVDLVHPAHLRNDHQRDEEEVGLTFMQRRVGLLLEVDQDFDIRELLFTDEKKDKEMAQFLFCSDGLTGSFFLLGNPNKANECKQRFD